MSNSLDCGARASAPVRPFPYRREVRQREDGGLLPWQIRRLQDHVEAHLDQTLPVSELAALLHRSRSHFSRVFKVSFGVPPHAYVIERRVARARVMMSETTDNLAQIAAACGCADQAHFCRLFRSAMGCTPREWRRRNRLAGPRPEPAYPNLPRFTEGVRPASLA